MIEAAMLWNEPNNLSHWDFELDPGWVRFAELVRTASAAIRAESPHLPIVLGGISPIDPSFVATMARHGVLACVDAVAVHVDGEPIRLTRREFELLRYLVANKNRVLSRDRLLERVWGYDQAIETRSVDVHVGRLRGKLRAAGQQIETVVGLGYRFVE